MSKFIMRKFDICPEVNSSKPVFIRPFITINSRSHTKEQRTIYKGKFYLMINRIYTHYWLRKTSTFWLCSFGIKFPYIQYNIIVKQIVIVTVWLTVVIVFVNRF